MIDETVGCAQALAQIMRERGIDRHSIEVLLDGWQRERQGMAVRYEQLLKDFGRQIDSITTTMVGGVATKIVHTETKTGYRSVGEALGGVNSEQILKDASIALDNWVQRAANKNVAQLENVWRIVDREFGAGVPVSIQRRMGEVFDRMKTIGFPPDAIKSVLESFKFVDKIKNAVTVQVNETGELMFMDALGNLFDANGKLAKAAEKATGSSPDFGPAMDILFNPQGKMAHAASTAVNGTNLDPALAGLEKKVESGLATAMDEAGTKAQAHAASKLGANIKEGVGAFGTALTSVATMGTQVMALGEAWNKPKEGIGDYLNLMAQFGGTVGSAIGVVDALSKAQAAFNVIAAANPIAIIVIAVIALIAAIVALIVYWDQVKAAIRDNPWLQVVAALFGVIGVIVLVIAYWDEIKLAVLRAANFISIQVQQIGAFFVGLKNLIGMVWDWIVASVYNLGVGILNAFIGFGASIVNFFIDLVNDVIGLYNSTAAHLPFVDEIAEVSRVNVEAIKIATKAVPEIDAGKAFATGPITGGLEGQIAKQEAVVRKAEEEDKARRDKAAQEKAAKEKEKAAAAGAAPGAVAAPATPFALPAGAPAVPEGAAALGAPRAGVPATGGPDQSVHVEGGIHVTITADRLEADSATLLTDDIVRRLQEKLDSLRAERDRRLGIRTPAAA